MKTNWFKKGFALLAGMAAMTACSSDGDSDKPKAPEFPEKQTVEIAAGETQTLTFEADADWKLTVDKTWCRFMDGAVETAQLQGKAGNQTVNVVVKDLNQGFDAATAKIDLSMGTMTQTIFEITRPGMTRKVTMYEKNGFGSAATIDPIEKVSLTFDGRRTESKEIGFTANFDWKILSVTEGFEMESIAGQAGQTTDDAEFKMTAISVAADKVPFAMTGEIVISDFEGNNSVSFPIEYTGMGSEDILFTPQNIMRGVDFSIDGHIKTNVGVTDEKTRSFSVAVKDMKYKTVVVEFDEQDKPTVVENAWLTIQDDKQGNITLSAGENEDAPRTVYCYILPEALAASYDYGKDMTDGWFESDYAFKVTQDGKSAIHGFAAYWGMNGIVPAENIIPFDQYPDFAGSTPDNIGAYGSPADNTFVYVFKQSDVQGMFSFGPLGFPDSYYPHEDCFRPIPSYGEWSEWEDDKFHAGQVYTDYLGGYVNGISIDPENLKTVTEGMLICMFYENAEQCTLWKACGALILIVEK